MDFGISFDAACEHEKALTSDGDEIGNRFLRLPEFSAGSDDKRSAVSDLTFIAGIFFFLLAGQNPGQLQDQNLLLPHQRMRAKETLAPLDQLGLSHFFDKAFKFDIAARYQSVGSMRAALQALIKRRDEPVAMDVDSQLKEFLELNDFQYQQQRRLRLEQALNWAFRSYGAAGSKSKGYVTASHTLNSIKEEQGSIRIRWDRNGEYLVTTYLWAAVVGGDLVWYTAAGEIGRAAFDSELDDGAPWQHINAAVDSELLHMLKATSADILPDFSLSHYVRDKFVRSWDKALELSNAWAQPIFTIVYDSSQPVRENEHLLERVLSEPKMLSVIQSGFILLVVERNEVPAHCVLTNGDAVCGVIENTQWTRERPLVANRSVARDLALELESLNL